MTAIAARNNRNEWTRSATARATVRDTKIFDLESALIQDISEEFQGLSILDIGIGTGRSTSYLLPISKKYVGIDYSEAMVDVARSAYPDVDIRHGDARDLSAFSDGSFDLVWFSFNGLDYISHEDRLKVLAEVRRVVKPEGAFGFSAHNADIDVRPAHDLSHIRLSLNPLRVGKSVLVFAAGLYNSFFRKKHEIRSLEYSILNDEGNYYKLLTYYITEDNQIAQLKAAGFPIVKSYRADSIAVPGGGVHPEEFMIYYLARPKEPAAKKSVSDAA